MDFFTGSNDLGTLGLGLLIAGAAAGLVRGVLGAGGGLILVPALYHVFGEAGASATTRLHIATTTTLACLLPTALNALAHHGKSGDFASQLPRSLAIAFGALAGAAVSLQIPTGWTVILFGATALAVALHAVFGRDDWRGAAGGVTQTLIAFPLGGLAALLGIGGASLFLPAATLSGQERPLAQASLAAVLICAIGGAAGVVLGWNAPYLPKYSYGYFNLFAFAAVAPVMYATAAASARYAAVTDMKKARAGFAVLVLITAGKMVWDAVG